MATKNVRMRVCDLHQGTVPAAETVRVSMNGTTTKIDVCADHLAEVKGVFSVWEKRGSRRAAQKRPSGGRKTAGTRRSRASRGPKNADVRAWAREQGIDVSDRGRIPKDVVAAYQAAH